MGAGILFRGGWVRECYLGRFFDVLGVDESGIRCIKYTIWWMSQVFGVESTLFGG